MSYALLSDDLLLQLEGAGVSRDARLLHLEAIVYCATALTDGDIRVRLARFSDADDPDAAAQELLDAGLWTKTTDGYAIADYLDHQQPAAEVERKREEARVRADRSRRHKRGDHSRCYKGDYCRHGALSPPSRARHAHGSQDVRSPILSNPSQREGEGKVKAARSTAPDGASDRDPDMQHLELLRQILLDRGWSPKYVPSGQLSMSSTHPDGLSGLVWADEEHNFYYQVHECDHPIARHAPEAMAAIVTELESAIQQRLEIEPRLEADYMNEADDKTWACYYLNITGIPTDSASDQDALAHFINQYHTWMHKKFKPYLDAQRTGDSDDE